MKENESVFSLLNRNNFKNTVNLSEFHRLNNLLTNYAKLKLTNNCSK